MASEIPFQTLDSVAELEDPPATVAAEEAQRWCNFVVYTPTSLPSGCTLSTGTLRKDAPAGRSQGSADGRTPWSASNPSAYRFEISGEGRRLRIKEFVYDWNFPALDHPCLWGSETRAVPLDDRYVVWFGVDYMKRPGASARLARTLIELSVMEGQFDDEEILALYRSMVPADPDFAKQIHGLPFATLSYWSRRHDAEMVTTPVGLWNFRRKHDEGSHEGDWNSPPESDADLARFGLPSSITGFTIDSAARFHNAAGETEYEFVYTNGADRGHELRLIAQESGKGRLNVPAEAESHPGTRTETVIDGTDLQLAWIDTNVGPFDAVFNTHGVDVKILTSAGVGMDRAWFEKAIREILQALRVRST